MKAAVRGKSFPKKKKKILLLILVMAVVIASVGGVIYWRLGKKAGSANAKRQGFGTGSFSASGYSGISTQGKVTASGVTNMGTVSETFNVTELETELKIAEVYVASGDTLKAGDKVLKLTKESVESARKELEDKESETELSYRTGVIEYERSKIAAEYDRDSTKLSGTQADGVYKDSLLDVSQDVETAQSKLDQAKQQISEYASYIDSEAAKAYFKVDEYQKLYDENLKLLTDNMEKYGVAWSQVTSGGGASSSAGGMSGMPSSSGGDFSGMGGDFAGGVTTRSFSNDEYNQWVSILKNLYSVLEQNKKDLDEAKANYEEAMSTASLEKSLLELSLPELEENLAQAKASYEKALLENELTKEKSLSNAERADHDYETALEKAESDYETLKSAWEDAKANLETFEAQVGDGFFYASADGSVLRTSARAGGALRAAGTVFTYSDVSAMTVTVSVDQSDVAKITPGDAALVMSQKGAMMDGVVKSVNPVSTSESRNNVTYSVTVELNGAGGLGSNESVTVVFGMTTADVSSSGNSSGSSSGGSEGGSGEGKGSRPDFGGQRPEGMPDFGGEMPEGFSGFGGGERPEGMPGDGKGKDAEE